VNRRRFHALTPEECWSLHQAGRQECASLKVELKESRRQTAVFKAELDKCRAELAAVKSAQAPAAPAGARPDSSNSHMPPSKDLAKPERNNSRVKSERKKGGQPGHAGTTLKASDKPDIIVPIRPEACPCGHRFTDADDVIKIDKRQVVDLPKPKPFEVTEYQGSTLLCPCCSAQTKPEFPVIAPASLQYGPRLQAQVAYLNGHQLLPVARTVEVLADLHGVKIATGTVDNILSSVADKAEDGLAQIKQQLETATVEHFDETGMGPGWMHVAATLLLTLYSFSRQRGKDAMDSFALLPVFKGVAVHDFLASYGLYTQCRHSACGAHLLRECQGLIDSFGSRWAASMKTLLQEACAAANRARDARLSGLPPETIASIIARYRAILAEAEAELPPPPERLPGQRGRLKLGKQRSLLKRLTERQDWVLLFLSDLDVPFTNNQAERDLRMPKLKQKTGATRSDAGAERFCKIRSITSTLRKQGKPLLSTLEAMVRGQGINLRVA
jgi:transposase